MSKKLILVAGVAGVGYLYASQNGLLFPGEDDEFQDDDDFDADPEDLNINNPLALLAISLATQAGLRAASKAVKRVAAPKTTPPSNITPAKAGASSVKPAVPSKTPAVAEPPAKPKPAVATASTPPTQPTTSGTKPATPATNAAAAQPPARPPTAAANTTAKKTSANKLLAKLRQGPAELVVMIISAVLMRVMDLDVSKFMNCATGEYDLDKMPNWAQAMIGAIPFLGDLFDLIGNKMCFRGGCPREAPDESAGLCYKPCDPGFKSDGAIMCYKQYPEFESNGMGHTITSITKKILMDTGKIPSRCGDGEVKSGALCYENVEGYTNVAGVAWQNCPAGFTDTGVRCEKLHDVGAGRIPGLNPCPPGEHDDGISCWRQVGQVCGDDCSKGWDGCRRRGLFGECWGGCRESCSPVRVISRTAFDRGQYTAPHEDKIDGLNYNKCPEGMSHQPGMPYLCTASFTKQSRVMAPRSMKCERKAKAGIAAGAVEWEEEINIAGLCYGDIPKGYSRKVVGTLDQDCPPGSTDFGVGCTRQAYNRGAGLIPLGIRFKDRLP